MTTPTWIDASDGPLVTVIVCTRNRADGLLRCLQSLQALRYSNLRAVTTAFVTYARTGQDCRSHATVGFAKPPAT